MELGSIRFVEISGSMLARSCEMKLYLRSSLDTQLWYTLPDQRQFSLALCAVFSVRVGTWVVRCAMPRIRRPADAQASHMLTLGAAV